MVLLCGKREVVRLKLGLSGWGMVGQAMAGSAGLGQGRLVRAGSAGLEHGRPRVGWVNEARWLLEEAGLHRGGHRRKKMLGDKEKGHTVADDGQRQQTMDNNERGIAKN